MLKFYDAEASLKYAPQRFDIFPFHFTIIVSIRYITIELCIHILYNILGLLCIDR